MLSTYSPSAFVWVLAIGSSPVSLADLDHAMSHSFVGVLCDDMRAVAAFESSFFTFSRTADKRDGGYAMTVASANRYAPAPRVVTNTWPLMVRSFAGDCFAFSG